MAGNTKDLTSLFLATLGSTAVVNSEQDGLCSRVSSFLEFSTVLRLRPDIDRDVTRYYVLFLRSVLLDILAFPIDFVTTFPSSIVC